MIRYLLFKHILHTVALDKNDRHFIMQYLSFIIQYLIPNFHSNLLFFLAITHIILDKYVGPLSTFSIADATQSLI